MYKFTDNDKTNRDVEDARQRFRALYERVCNFHQREPRVAVLAMVSLLIDECQPNSEQFSIHHAHELCEVVHQLAEKIVEHHTGPAKVTEKPAEPQGTLTAEETDAYEGLFGTKPTKHLH